MGNSARIRVAYVIDNLRMDGTQAALVNLVEGLARRDYEQAVYCLNDVAHPKVIEALQDRGAQVTIIGKAKLLCSWGLMKLFADFRRIRPHIVQTFLPFSDWIGRTTARSARVPVIVSSVRARNVDKKWWQLLLDRATVGFADRVVFNSRHAVSFAREKEGVRPSQVVYIPNGVCVPESTPEICRNTERSKLGIGPETNVIGMVGRLYPQKGHAYLLAAFSRLHKELPESVLLIVGEGPLLEELKSQAQKLGLTDSVFFLGQRADVPALLECFDLYVQSSLWEGMPNAVMEAMAHSMPVVATSVDGVNELIVHGQTGWLVPPADPVALAERMTWVPSNRMEAQRVGTNAGRTIRSEYSVDRMVSDFDTLYRTLLEGC